MEQKNQPLQGQIGWAGWATASNPSYCKESAGPPTGGPRVGRLAHAWDRSPNQPSHAMNPPIATPPHLPASTATPPATAAEVLAALERLHKKTDALLNLIHRKPQP